MTTDGSTGADAAAPRPTTSSEDLARKAIRVRRLTDPLGAMGQRRAADRREAERAARRALAVAAGAGFLASFGLVALAGGGDPGGAVAPTVAAPPPLAAASGRVISEVPVALPDGPATLRIVASGDAPARDVVQAPRPRLRTRQS